MTTNNEVKLPELPSDATVSAIAHYLSRGDVDTAKNLMQEYGIKCFKDRASAESSRAGKQLPTDEQIPQLEKFNAWLQSYPLRDLPDTAHPLPIAFQAGYEAGMRKQALQEVSDFGQLQSALEEIDRLKAEVARIGSLETLLAAAQNEARTAEESLAKVVQQREDLREDLRAELAAVRAQAQKPVYEQNARFAIDGAIQYGRMGINKPPAADHWLMEYWLIGQSLAQPAQEPRKPTDISAHLLEYASNPGYSHNDYADTMRAAVEEIERYYGGMVAWKRTAEAKDAAAQQPAQADVPGKYRPLFTNPPAAQQDQWKESLIERCVRAGTTFNPDDPESTLTNLINWEVAIATDPKVNGQEKDVADAERYREFFNAGLPITFCGIEYHDKASLDSSIDAAIQAVKEGK